MHATLHSNGQIYLPMYCIWTPSLKNKSLRNKSTHKTHQDAVGTRILSSDDRCQIGCVEIVPVPRAVNVLQFLFYVCIIGQTPPFQAQRKNSARYTGHLHCVWETKSQRQKGHNQYAAETCGQRIVEHCIHMNCVSFIYHAAKICGLQFQRALMPCHTSGLAKT